MAVPTQKSIIITTSLPTLAKTKTNSLVISGNINPAVVEGLGCGDGYKKRKRLTHLSPDERLLRRKLKNRVAAQTARDKKKARMDELEHAVSLLAEENKRLQQENQALKQKSGTLAKENDTLKERLGMRPLSADFVKATESCESAVLLVPPQQEQIQKLCSRSVQAAKMLLACSLIYFLGCGKNCKKQQLNWPKKSPLRQTRRPCIIRHHQRQLLRWWGPQQNSWNPSKN
jgi:X box-binding protein 1